MKFLILSPDEQRYAIGTDNGAVELNRLGEAEPTALEALGGEFPCAGFSNDGALLIGGNERGRAIAWDVDSGAPLDVLNCHHGVEQCEVISPGFYITMDVESVVRLWRRDPDGILGSRTCEIGDCPLEFAWNERRRRLVFATGLSWILWDVDEQRVDKFFEPETGLPQDAMDGLETLSKNGEWFFSYCSEGLVFSCETGEPLHRWARTVAPDAVCISDRGDRTAIATFDGRIVIQDAGETVRVIQTGNEKVVSLDMTASGRLVSFVDKAGGYGIFETDTGKSLLAPKT